MNSIFFEEIMNLKSEGDFSLINSLNLLKKYTNINLIMDDNNELIYIANINDLLLSDITSDDLISIRNGGWEISKDKKNIIKRI